MKGRIRGVNTYVAKSCLINFNHYGNLSAQGQRQQTAEFKVKESKVFIRRRISIAL